MEKFKMLPLSEIAELVIDYRGKTPKKLGGDWSVQGYRAISAKNVKTRQIVQSDSIRYLDESLYRKWMKEEIKRGDILITSEAPFGQLFYWDSDEKIVLSQRLFALRCKKEFYSPYIFHYMTSDAFQSDMECRATGTTVTGLRQPELLKCRISVPSFEKQKIIADTLSTIDAKIENNKRINHHLAEIAKSIFDSYFIDLSPYNGVMPDDWQLSNLTGIANYLNGLAMQKHRPQSNEQGLPVLKIKELRQGFTDSTSDLCSSNIRRDYIIHDGDVIFSWSGSLLVDFWTGGDCGLNQHLFKVSSETYDKWFYYAWTKHHLDRFVKMAADRATTMGHIKRDALEKAEVLIPSNKDYQEIGNKLKPIYDQIINNRVESRKLVALRDTLLPKLMSGEISVTD